MRNFQQRAWVWRILTVATCLFAIPGRGLAYQVSDDLEIRALYKGENYFRLTDSSRQLFNPRTETFYTEHNDWLMSQRNEIRLDIEYQLHTERMWPWLGKARFVGQLRPWYDSSYDLSNQGPGKYRRELSFWVHNFTDDLRDKSDPMFREYYVDLAPKHFFFRIGRQIIPWGKSDGVYMLDIVNPFNLRNPTIFEEENFKIPTWAINANWKPSADQNLQFLYIPRYIYNVWGGLNLRNNLPIEGRYHDWTYNIVGFFNDYYNGEFGFKVPVHLNQPADTLANSTVGLRWSDSFRRVNYTLNYLYTWTPGLIDFPNTGTFATADAVDRRPARMNVLGGSADYDINMGNDWLDGTALRIETALTLGDKYYKGVTGNPADTDHWGVLAGIDRTILSDYLQRPVFASLQYWHDLVVSTGSCHGCGPEAGSFQDLGFNGSRHGLRGPFKSLMTLYLSKNWMEGDTVITELFTLYEHQFEDWWIRAKVTYKFNDYTTVALGFNVFAGSKQAPYGEWKDNTDAFVELRYVLF